MTISLSIYTHRNFSFRSYPLSFIEPGNHTGETQCQLIADMLDDISTLAEHSPKLTLLDLEAIVFDSTSSNTGLNKGLAGCLIEGRKKLHHELEIQGDPPKLIVHKCEDHILNLISCDYEKELIKNSPSLQVSKKHRATDVVQYIVAKVFLFLNFIS
jgi:hypothetical protein